MKRATPLMLVMAAAFFHGVTSARAAGAAEQPEAAAVEVGGGPRQRWDCVAFASWADGEVYVVNLDGTGLTRLSADGRSPAISPAFSPDGTKIAYVCPDKDTDRSAVYVMNVDGTDKRRLSPPYDVPEPEVDTYEDIPELYAAGGDDRPVFSPDGKIIAATRFFVVMEPWDYEIIFFPTSGGPEENFSTKIEDAWERKRHTSATGYAPCGAISDLTFSGDGRRVAFLDYPDIYGSRMWVANADGSGVRLLARGPVYSHAFSPDGKKLAFYTWIHIEERRAIWVINADGTGRRQLTKGDRDNFSPAFSPDGKKIIYESSVRRERDRLPSDIYVMNADGSGPRALTRTPKDELGARFTPDGSKIVFRAWPPSGRDSAEDGIYVMNADGSGRRFLAAGDEFSLGPSLVEGRLLDSYGNWHDVVEDSEATTTGE